MAWYRATPGAVGECHGPGPSRARGLFGHAGHRRVGCALRRRLSALAPSGLLGPHALWRAAAQLESDFGPWHFSATLTGSSADACTRAPDSDSDSASASDSPGFVAPTATQATATTAAGTGVAGGQECRLAPIVQSESHRQRHRLAFESDHDISASRTPPQRLLVQPAQQHPSWSPLQHVCFLSLYCSCWPSQHPPGVVSGCDFAHQVHDAARLGTQEGCSWLRWVSGAGSHSQPALFGRTDG